MSSNDFSTRNLRDIKKLIKEFLADLRGELRIYDIIKKWEKKLAESGSGGDFRY